MSEYFGVIGSALVTLACFLFGRGYRSYVERRSAEYSAYLSFLEFMRREMLCSLSTPREIALLFSDEALERCGFLPALRDGATLHGAFLLTREASFLDGADAKILEGYFRGFGLGSLGTETRSLDRVIEELSPRVTLERDSSEKRARIGTVLLLLLAAAITVLLI